MVGLNRQVLTQLVQIVASNMNNYFLVSSAYFLRGKLDYEKIGVVVPTQPRQYDDVSLKGPCWQTSATAMDHFQVSRPTLKAMRERGEVEFIKPGRSYRYNICL